MYRLEHESIHVSKIKLTSETFSRKLFASPYIRLCLAVKGSAVWQIENRCVPVNAGDIVLLNPLQKRVFKEVSASQGIEIWVISFEPQVFATGFWQLFYPGRNQKIMSGEEQEAGQKMAPTLVQMAATPDMIRLFQEIVQETSGKKPDYRLMTGAKLLELLIFLKRSGRFSEEIDSGFGEDMQKVLQYIESYYTSDISLQQAAEVIHMSPSGFSKYFSRCMGMGFARYVMQKRVYLAVYLLQNSEKNVLDIALECGFHNGAGFYKAFQKVTGRNPKEFRKPGEERNV